jgi:hypothetical protein
LIHVFERIQEVIKNLLSSSPESIRLKRAELQAEECRIANFIEFVADGRGSRALAEALQASERKAETLRVEIQKLEASREAVIRASSDSLDRGTARPCPRSART